MVLGEGHGYGPTGSARAGRSLPALMKEHIRELVDLYGKKIGSLWSKILLRFYNWVNFFINEPIIAL